MKIDNKAQLISCIKKDFRERHPLHASRIDCYESATVHIEKVNFVTEHIIRVRYRVDAEPVFWDETFYIPERNVDVAFIMGCVEVPKWL